MLRNETPSHIELTEGEEENLTNGLPVKTTCVERIKKSYNNCFGNFLHIYFIIVFEFLFYFNYVVDVEKKQIENVLDSFLNDMKEYLSYVDPNTIADKLCDDFDSQFKSQNNSDLQETAYNIIWGMTTVLAMCIVIHFVLLKDAKLFMYTLLESVSFIAIISFFEYLFFTKIVMKYKVMNTEQAMCYSYNKISQN
jgi:hypothetical protein